MVNGLFRGLVAVALVSGFGISAARAEECKAKPPAAIVKSLKRQKIEIGRDGRVAVNELHCKYYGEFSVGSAAITATPTADNVWGGWCKYTCRSKITGVYPKPLACDGENQWYQSPKPKPIPKCPKLPRVAEETKEHGFNFSKSEYDEAVASPKGTASLCSVETLEARNICDPIFKTLVDGKIVVPAEEGSGVKCCYLGMFRGGATSSVPAKDPVKTGNDAI